MAVSATPPALPCPHCLFHGCHRRDFAPMSCWHSLQQFCPGCLVSFSSCVLEWSLPFPQLPTSYPLSGVLSSPSPLRPQLPGQLTTDIEPPHGWRDKNGLSTVCLGPVPSLCSLPCPQTLPVVSVTRWLWLGPQDRMGLPESSCCAMFGGHLCTWPDAAGSRSVPTVPHPH